MGFRLVPKSVTLNDLERHNGRYFALFYRIRQLLAPITSKWLKIDLHCLRQKYRLKDLVFSDVSFMVLFAEVTENECTVKRHLRNIISGARLFVPTCPKQLLFS